MLAHILVAMLTYGAGITCVTTILLTLRFCVSSKQRPVGSDTARVLAEGCVAVTSTPVLECRARLGSVQCSVRKYAAGVDDS